MNKIARINRLKNLQKIIIRVVIIKNRQYKRRLKKYHLVMLSKKIKSKKHR